jgi:4-diphosphocytidyl-2-C-methyl-D-erythritol kinase
VPAKINLCLGVGGPRPDGYHPLATVYQAVDIYDEVRAESTDDSDDIAVTVNLDSVAESAIVPSGPDNLAAIAAAALRDVLGVSAGVRLAIRKVIPVAGGMAGGSADAAAALLACNAIWGGGLSRDELAEIAADIGSDVPFLLHGGNAMGGGRGEQVSPILAKGSYYWAVAVAEQGLPTPDVFAEFDRLNPDRDPHPPEVPGDLLAALRSGDPVALGDALSNDLTAAALSLRPDLEDVLAVGRGAGALGAIVSGSGPTCLFLGADEAHRLDLSMALASAAVCADVIQARGPVPGAQLI